MVETTLRRDNRILTIGKRNSSDNSTLLLFFGFFLFLAVFVSVEGNFPLNDDWSYGKGVQIFLQQHQFHMPTVCAPGFAHVLLGALASQIFGFSYEILRCVSLTMGIVGTVSLYKILREIGIHKYPAIFLSFVYAANPLMINLYFSFMSDTTALALTNLFILFLLRAVRRDSYSYAVASLLVLLIAMSVRQSAIIFIPCYLSLLSLRKGSSINRYVLILSSLVLPYLVYINIDHWLLTRAGLGHDYGLVKEAHLAFLQDLSATPFASLWNITSALGMVCCYLGLFCLPILLSFIIKIKKLLVNRTLPIWLLAAIAITAISVFQLVIQERRLMPFNQNLLRIPIIGAIGIMGIEIPSLKPRQALWLTDTSYALSLLLMTICGTSLIKLQPILTALATKFKSNTAKWQAQNWIILYAAFASIVFSTVESLVRCSDRYFLIALAPTIMLLGIYSRWFRIQLATILPIASLILIALYGTFAAQDFLNWNRARWLGLDSLEKHGFCSKEIDGGAEYNIERDLKIYESTYRGTAPRKDWRWWPVHGETYIVSFSPIPGYNTIERIPFWSSLSFSTKEILILKKSNHG